MSYQIAQFLRERLRRREALQKIYCDQKGWPANPKRLTLEQLLEIQRQPEWQKPDISRLSNYPD